MEYSPPPGSPPASRHHAAPPPPPSSADEPMDPSPSVSPRQTSSLFPPAAAFQSAPHTPPEPHHRPIPLPPVTPYDSPAPASPPPAYTRLPVPGTDTGLQLPPSALAPSSNPTELIRIPLPAPSATPLDPPPSVFSTPTPWRIKPHAFAPFRIPSAGPALASGWEPLYAPALSAHGIAPADWGRFLADLHAAGTLALDGVSAIAPHRPGQPALARRTVLAGPRAVAGGPYDRAFGRTPVEEVRALLEVWNGSAWERRRVRVSLMGVGDEAGTRRERWELMVEAM